MLILILTLHTIFWLMLVVYAFDRFGIDPLNPLLFFHVFYFISFIIRPWLVHLAGFEFVTYYTQYVPPVFVYVKTLLVASLGCGVFQWVLMRQLRSAGRELMTRKANEYWRSKTVIWVVLVVVLPLGMYSIYESRNFDGYVIDEVTGITTYGNSTGYIIESQAMLFPVLVAIVILFRFTILSWIPVLAYFGYVLTFVRARWQLAILALAIWQAVYVMKGKRKAWTWLCVGALVTGPIFYIKGADRSFFTTIVETGRVVMPWELTGDTSFKANADGMDFANYDYLAYIVGKVPSESGTFTYWTQWLQLFTEPIPRMLWAGKPVGPPVQLINLNDYGNFIGCTYSIFGDGWISFGCLGVIVNAAMIAFFAGKAYGYFRRNQHRVEIFVGYVLFNGLLIQAYRDGGVLSLAKFMFFTITPLFLWYRLTNAWANVDTKK